jgi:hypothetical protein
MECGTPLSKACIDSAQPSGDIERHVLDFAHGHLYRARTSTDITLPRRRQTVRSRARRQRPEYDNTSAMLIRFDCPNLKARQRRIDARTRLILKSKRQVANSRQGHNRTGSWRVVWSLRNSQNDGPPLRVRKSDNFSQDFVTGVVANIPLTGEPRMNSARAVRKRFFELDLIAFRPGSRCQIRDISGSHQLQRLGEHGEHAVSAIRSLPTSSGSTCAAGVYNVGTNCAPDLRVAKAPVFPAPWLWRIRLRGIPGQDSGTVMPLIPLAAGGGPAKDVSETPSAWRLVGVG